MLTLQEPWQALGPEEIANPGDIGARVASRLLRRRQDQLPSLDQLRDRRKAHES